MGLLGDRFGWIRLAVFPAVVSDVVALRADGPTTADWLFALLAGVVSLGAGFVPLATVVGQAGLLICTDLFGHSDAVSVILLAALALLELIVRRRGWPVAVGCVAMSVPFVVQVLRFHAVLPGMYHWAWVVGPPMLAGLYVRSLRENSRRSRERMLEGEQRRELGMLNARLGERTAIARELHDVVAHHVASIVLRVAVARHVIPETDPRMLQVLDDVHAAATTALTDMRKLVGVLRDPSAVNVELGSLLVDPAELPQVLREVVDRAANSGLRVEATIDPALAGMDAVRGLVVLRLVQEGLTNVFKHGGPAGRARLTVAMSADGTARVEVHNEGPPVRSATPGHGLVGLSERVTLIGGEISAGPARDGWLLSAMLPAGAA
ncbi:sensor histidine kinase [Longispora fulva]|uniref:histidine kinase n=1 Tax=Longispora fulva TaxID=619741 RepID=A0A8J7G8T2_9ACTN|nr:histidine kinase [Longispora fulva]MBG6135055.1 signal transduction histidine kinase [Longispora fulva]